MRPNGAERRQRLNYARTDRHVKALLDAGAIVDPIEAFSDLAKVMRLAWYAGISRPKARTLIRGMIDARIDWYRVADEFEAEEALDRRT